MKTISRFIRYTLLFYGIIALLYWILVRPGFLNWGASSPECTMQLEADQFIPEGTVVSTRAINIHASREQVWPWILQTGQNRGGFQSYDWLENLFAAQMLNAGSIQPQWQNTQVGDTVYYGKKQGWGLVSAVKPSEYYSINGWTFLLLATDSGHTRLLVRYPSMPVKQNIGTTLYYYSLFESLHFVMETGMMMGIKSGAERKTTCNENTTTSIF